MKRLSVPMLTSAHARNYQSSTASKRKLSTERMVDLCLFGVLMAFICLFNLQHVAGWITEYRVRELLYLYLYARIFISYRVRLTPLLLLVFLYLLYAVFIAVHTQLVYGSEMALQGFLRFLNVALLAPLAATLLTELRHVKIFVGIWLTVVALGAASALYQLFGGDLSWLVRGYLEIRGDGLVRFMTLLGEPNNGGMAGVIAYVFAMLAVRSWPWKAALLLVALILIGLSISKAALAGFLIATLLMVLYNRKTLSHSKVLQRAALSGLVMMLTLAVVIGVSFELRQGLLRYGETALTAFAGAGDLLGTDYGIGEDLTDRMIGRTAQGVQLAIEESDLYILNFFLGNSFGIAGSAARTVLGDNAILPHNSFSEVYLVGGVVMLTFFVAIIVMTFRQLQRRRRHDDYYLALLVAFITLVAFSPTYPIIYAFVLGSLFWLLVGCAANYELSVAKPVDESAR